MYTYIEHSRVISIIMENSVTTMLMPDVEHAQFVTIRFLQVCISIYSVVHTLLFSMRGH